MSVYALTLFTHSYVRWVVVATALLVSVRGAIGWARDRPWSRADEISHRALMVAVDAQFTLGVVMYLFLSPFSRVIYSNFAVAYQDPTLRFFGLEHPIAMITAVSLVYFGREGGKRARTDRVRHRRACTWTTAAVLLALASIPWPFLAYGRPLLRAVF